MIKEYRRAHNISVVNEEVVYSQFDWDDNNLEVELYINSGAIIDALEVYTTWFLSHNSCVQYILLSMPIIVTPVASSYNPGDWSNIVFSNEVRLTSSCDLLIDFYTRDGLYTCYIDDSIPLSNIYQRHIDEFRKRSNITNVLYSPKESFKRGVRKDRRYM